MYFLPSSLFLTGETFFISSTFLNVSWFPVLSYSSQSTSEDVLLCQCHFFNMTQNQTKPQTWHRQIITSFIWICSYISVIEYSQRTQRDQFVKLKILLSLMLTYFLPQNFSGQKEGSGCLILRFFQLNREVFVSLLKEIDIPDTWGKNKLLWKYMPVVRSSFFLHSSIHKLWIRSVNSRG